MKRALGSCESKDGTLKRLRSALLNYRKKGKLAVVEKSETAEIISPFFATASEFENRTLEGMIKTLAVGMLFGGIQIC